jgi:MFS family permease
VKLLKEYPFTFRLMFYGMLISTTGASMIWPFLMIYVKGRLNLPLTVITSLLTINAAAGLVASFVAGPIVDRLGRKWIMVISLVGNGLTYLMLSQANTLPAFAVLMALSGTFNPLYRLSGDAMLADLIPPQKRPDAYALLRLSNNVGVALGPSIGGLLTTISYTVAFSCAAFGMITYSLMLAFLAAETLPRRVEQGQPLPETSGGYVHILRDKPFISFTITFILIQMCAVLMWVLMPVYANGQFKIPESQYGLIPTTNALMVVFLQIFVTKVTKRYQPMRMITLGAIFYAFGVGSVAFGRGFWGFWISMVIMTFGELILMPTSSTYVAALAPADMRGRYMGLYGLSWGIASGIAPVAGGYLNDNFSPVAVWIGGLFIGLIAAIGFAMLSRFNLSIQYPSLTPDKDTSLE